MTSKTSTTVQTAARAAVTMLAAAALAISAVAPAGADVEPSDVRALSSGLGAPSPKAVAMAKDAPLAVHTLRPESGGGTVSSIGRRRLAPTILVLAAQAGDDAARARVLEQVRSATTGGQEPGGAGGLTAQDEMAAYALLALVRHDPTLWGALDTGTRERADLVMTAALVGAAFTTSDANPYLLAGEKERTIEGNPGVGRDYNPNYREGMFGSVLAGRAYFGEESAKEHLAAFDLDTFLTAATTAGLTNLTTIWSTSLTTPDAGAPSGAEISKAVHDWAAYGDRLTDPMGVLESLATDTFSATVSCGLNGGAGVTGTTPSVGGKLETGCEGLPNLGQPGMILEFDTIDGDGPRSSAFYAFSTAQATVLNQILARATCAWREGETADKIRMLTVVGLDDFFYKVDHGYRNFQLGRYRGTLLSSNPEYFFPLLVTGWSDVLRDAELAPPGYSPKPAARR